MSNDLVVGVSGASGAGYARRLLQMLIHTETHVHLIVSPPARYVIADELGIERFSVAALVGRDTDEVTLYSHRDVGARLASGSFRTRGMVICPCSNHTLAAIASGLGDNLMTRAAMVTLKEARKLVVVPREMPFGLIELENMTRLARAGAIIAPANPGFYMKPTRIDELFDFVAGRVLDLLELPHDLNTRWRPPEGDALESMDDA